MGICRGRSPPGGQLQALLEFPGTICEEKRFTAQSCFSKPAKTLLWVGLQTLRKQHIRSTEIFLLYRVVVESRGLSQAARVQIPALPLSGCVTLGKLLHLSVTRIPHL